jgi:hypothetical protein
LQGWRLVINPDNRLEALGAAREQSLDCVSSLSRKIDSHTARHDAVHHHAMAETLGGSLQDFLTQQRAMGMEHHDAGVIADGTHVIHMMRQALKLRHDGAQQDSTRRWAPP